MVRHITTYYDILRHITTYPTCHVIRHKGHVPRVYRVRDSRARGRRSRGSGRTLARAQLTRLPYKDKAIQ